MVVLWSNYFWRLPWVRGGGCAQHSMFFIFINFISLKCSTLKHSAHQHIPGLWFRSCFKPPTSSISGSALDRIRLFGDWEEYQNNLQNTWPLFFQAKNFFASLTFNPLLVKNTNEQQEEDWIIVLSWKILGEWCWQQSYPRNLQPN